MKKTSKRSTNRGLWWSPEAFRHYVLLLVTLVGAWLVHKSRVFDNKDTLLKNQKAVLQIDLANLDSIKVAQSATVDSLNNLIAAQEKKISDYEKELLAPRISGIDDSTKPVGLLTIWGSNFGIESGSLELNAVVYALLPPRDTTWHEAGPYDTWTRARIDLGSFQGQESILTKSWENNRILLEFTEKAYAETHQFFVRRCDAAAHNMPYNSLQYLCRGAEIEVSIKTKDSRISNPKTLRIFWEQVGW